MSESPGTESLLAAPRLTRGDQYRDLLEGWVEWWNNIGRFNYGRAPIPPLTATGEALACTACVGVGPYEVESGPDRCQVCHRRIP